MEDLELPEYLRLHQMVVRRIGEICRIVNQVDKLWFCFNRVHRMSAEGVGRNKTWSNQTLRAFFLCSSHFQEPVFCSVHRTAGRVHFKNRSSRICNCPVHHTRVNGRINGVAFIGNITSSPNVLCFAVMLSLQTHYSGMIWHQGKFSFFQLEKSCCPDTLTFLYQTQFCFVLLKAATSMFFC